MTNQVNLVIAEHDHASIKASTLNTIAAAQKIGGDIHVLDRGQQVIVMRGSGVIGCWVDQHPIALAVAVHEAGQHGVEELLRLRVTAERHGHLRGHDSPATAAHVPIALLTVVQ